MLVPIHLASSKQSLGIVGISSAKQRELRVLLQTLVSNLPRITVQLPAYSDIQQLLFAIVLSIMAYEKHISPLFCPAILCYGTLEVGGRLQESVSLRDAATLACDAGIGLVLAGSKKVLPSASEGVEYSSSTTIDEAFSILCRYSLQHQDEKVPATRANEEVHTSTDPFSSIIGLKEAKQALLYAASGNLPILLYGPPGSGKSLLINCISSLLPPLTEELRGQVSAIHGTYTTKPPVFEISPSMSLSTLTKGNPPLLAKAHGGVLLVDELSRQKPSIRSSLASWMDSCTIGSYPFKPLVACATNGCNCANLGSNDGICRCSEEQIDSFWAKLGYPLLDRFAIIIALQSENLLLSEVSTSRCKYDRIKEVRIIQKKRTDEDIRGLLPLFTRTRRQNHVSFRRSLLCCKLAQVIADFEGKTMVTQEIMERAQSLYLLPKDRHYH